MKRRWRNRLVFHFDGWREFWRWVQGRDNCEQCDGKQGVRGNENVVNFKIVCDYCAAKMR